MACGVAYLAKEDSWQGKGIGFKEEGHRKTFPPRERRRGRKGMNTHLIGR